MGRLIVTKPTTVEPRKTAYEVLFGYERGQLLKLLAYLIEMMKEIPDRPSKEVSQLIEEIEQYKTTHPNPLWISRAISWATQRKISAVQAPKHMKEVVQTDEVFEFLEKLYYKDRYLFYRTLPLLSKYAINNKDSWKLSLSNEKVRQDIIENVLPLLQKRIPALRSTDIPTDSEPFGTKQNYHQIMKRRFGKYLGPRAMRKIIWKLVEKEESDEENERAS